MSGTIAPRAREHDRPHTAATFRVHWRALALAACLLAFALRLFLLDAKSIWLDEVLTIQAAEAGQAALWAGRSDRYHPPLYYGLVEQSAPLGESAYALRFSAALFGVLSIPAAFAFARALLGLPVAITAAGLIALSPLLIWYAQEARNYSMVTCLGLIASTGYLLLQRHAPPRARIGWWLVFVTSSVAALYTHYGALLLIPAQGMLFTALWASGRTRLSTLPWNLAGWLAMLVAFVPWLRSNAARALLVLLRDDRTFNARAVADLVGVPLSGLFLPLTGAALLLGLLGLAALHRFFRRPRPWLNALRANAFFQVGSLLLFLLLLLLSVYPRGHSLKRQLLVLWPYVIVLIAWCWPWAAQFRRSLQWLLLASWIAALITIVAVPKDQWREATAYVTLSAGPGDALTTLPNYQAIPFEYYNRGRVPVVTLAGNEIDDQLDQARAGYEQLWVAFHTTDRAGPQAEVERWLREHATLAERRTFYHIDLRLYRFERP